LFIINEIQDRNQYYLFMHTTSIAVVITVYKSIEFRNRVNLMSFF